MRLIDADKIVLNYGGLANIASNDFIGIAELFLKQIQAMPTIDAVPLVRCKDCIHYESGACLKIYSDGNVNNDAWQERNPDDYCSYGERRDSDATD